MDARKWLAGRMGGSSWMMTALPWISAVDRRLSRVSGGRLGLVDLAGLPRLTLEVPGRKSGELRTTPLLCVPSGRGWLIAGSNLGNESKPAWALNLDACDYPTVIVHGKRHTVTRSQLEGDERALAWQEMLEVWPNFAVYQQRTGRTIPVYRLNPVN